MLGVFYPGQAYPGQAEASLVLLDSSVVTLTLIPSSVETRESTDANTAVVLLVPNSSDISVSVDSGTVSLVLAPNAVETAQFADSTTVLLTLLPGRIFIFDNLLLSAQIVGKWNGDLQAQLRGATARSNSIAGIFVGRKYQGDLLNENYAGLLDKKINGSYIGRGIPSVTV